ncbi:molybdate ABC transporter substrate-binding protein [Janibacter sp. YIM B02568]|uniref:molybdate ABC transporter substrate-binding protein n=1 Tax=Janibacter endophyticus TaxID=2806261 RepID=UPI00194E74AE|nr:molybdate ABC transporter substrate-binding protein [Janibacter endophyticus]MBM6544639.1 molybdate ABC transporter substrate-binding protein [Janibacter endophyticus]
MRAAPALLAIVLTAAAGCSGSSTSDDSQALTVFAAASLQKPFEELARDLEAEHPGLRVTLSFAGSSDLVAQLSEGATADVLATADETTMDKAVAGGLVTGSPRRFVSNTMTILVPPGNPAGITSLAHLASGDAAVVVCAPQVPCGAATERIEEAAGISLTPASEESKVTDVLGKVASGEADAGIVYVTDAARSSDVEAVEIPAQDNTTTRYPVVVLADSKNAELAEEFAELVVADGAGQGEGRLEDAGFAAP